MRIRYKYNRIGWQPRVIKVVNLSFMHWAQINLNDVFLRSEGDTPWLLGNKYYNHVHCLFSHTRFKLHMSGWCNLLAEKIVKIVWLRGKLDTVQPLQSNNPLKKQNCVVIWRLFLYYVLKHFLYVISLNFDWYYKTRLPARIELLVVLKMGATRFNVS